MEKKDPFKLSSYHYELPQELVAQHPCSQRDHSRLMIVERSTGQMTEIKFYELEDFLKASDRLVLNNTKVMRARLNGLRRGGGHTEIFLLKPCIDGTWDVLAKPAKKLSVGSTVTFGEDHFCQVVEEKPDGVRRVKFHTGHDELDDFLKKYGKIALPHYIRDGEEGPDDESSYQTIYAQHLGAAAAPTAGLHFTQELLGKLDKKNVEQVMVTLHTGAGTFRPVRTDDIREHSMHLEHYVITPESALLLNTHKALSREICVGTTCCRALESASDANGLIHAGSAETQAYIYPGYQFKYVKGLLTNFHWPQSSLLMLVCAFAGYELTMEAYRKAVLERFRFFSYGDAMLIL